MDTDVENYRNHRDFAIICVLGAPGAGKGTICTHLAQTYKMTHYSIGDSLRELMRKDSSTPLAAQIQDKLDNQGFLSSDDLNPLVGQAIKDALCQDNPKSRGILIDGFPRCMEQLESFDAWPFGRELSLVLDDFDDEDRGEQIVSTKPDVVLSFQVTKNIARARYTARARDQNDQIEKFERRFAEYLADTAPVEEQYRQRGIVIEIDTNGTKEDTIREVMTRLQASKAWQHCVIQGRATSHLAIQGEEERLTY